MRRGGRLPQQRATPRRKVHPLQPPRANEEPDPSPSEPDAPIVRESARERPLSDFRERVLDATSPRGRCEGTPGCAYSGPHEGHHAHHRHTRGAGGTDHTLNGAWLCSAGHAWVHEHIAEARALDLYRSWSDPWPEPDEIGT